MKPTTKVLAWHFVGPTLRDGRPVPEDGKVLRYRGRPVMCASGLHASRRLLDALRYAPGATICRVEMAGVEDEEDDKLVARERTVLWRVDGGRLLHDFARRCALDVVDKWDAPEVVREYLRTGDESIRSAAWSAAWSATMSAARSAAWSAAMSAAVSAAGSAAGSAAWSAAWSAAMSAAGSAAGSAARSAQNRRLTAMVTSARRSA